MHASLDEQVGQSMGDRGRIGPSVDPDGQDCGARHEGDVAGLVIGEAVATVVAEAMGVEMVS